MSVLLWIFKKAFKKGLWSLTNRGRKRKKEVGKFIRQHDRVSLGFKS